jgi:NAD(P)-dependent dehydrogenase (short-subunit alcohol dehydrogenase family)
MRFSGKVAVVTGGARGIGAAIAFKLGSEGAKVVVADIDEGAGRYREAWLRERGIDASFIKADVSREADVASLFNAVVEKYGGVDILVNNAGIGNFKDFFEETLEDWYRVINTNLTGPYLCSKYAARIMARRGGVIINIASTRAFQSEPNTVPYSASKGGLIALTHALAVTLARYKIRVVSVSPGWIDTSEWQIPPRRPQLNKLDHSQHLTGRVGDPMDVANLVAFLASDEASWISGVNFTIDGGMTVKMIYLDPNVIGEAVASLTGDDLLARGLAQALARWDALSDEERSALRRYFSRWLPSQ